MDPRTLSAVSEQLSIVIFLKTLGAYRFLWTWVGQVGRVGTLWGIRVFPRPVFVAGKCEVPSR